MKRWIVAIVCLAVLFLLSQSRETEIGSLKPVEVLHLYIEEGRICVETDTKDRGTGMTLNAALKDLRESSSGEIFLETVSYVLVTEESKTLLEKLSEILRPATEAVLVTGQVDLEDTAQFFAVHRPDFSLREYAAGQTELPKLMTAGERCYLVQPAND